MKKRIMALCLTMLLVLSGCGSNGSQNAETGDSSGSASGMALTAVEDTLTIGATSEVFSLDPPSENDSSSGQVIVQIFDGLVQPDYENGGVKPCLAESWEMIDDVTYRFHLREGVMTHNGDELTAEDVLYTVERGVASSYKQYVWGCVDAENSQVVDTYTIDIKLLYPNASFLQYLVDPGASIVSKAGVEAAGGEEAHGRNPLGATGPYKFKEWIAGDRIVLERNENYWGDAPYFKNLVFRVISDGTSRSLSLETGEIDFAFDILPAQVEQFEASDAVDVIRYDGMTTTYLCFNTAHEPLNDVRVRQALRYALDLESMVNVAFAGTGSVGDGPLTPTNADYSAPGEDVAYTYNLEKAKELLAEAGYPDGFTISLWTNENQARIDLAEMIQNAWGQIGVTVEYTIMEFASMLELESAGEHDCFIQGFVSVANSGDTMYDKFYSTSGYTSNTAAYQNPKFDELMDTARGEFDDATRKEIYAEVQDLLREELPWIYLQFNENLYGIRSTLTGFNIDPGAMPRFATIVPKAS